MSIIGGRFGSVAFDGAHSVSQIELKTAVMLNKQLYVFVERSVYAEYKVHLNNKELENLRFASADDRRILTFIEDIERLPKNNQTTTFEGADDIIAHLREQWAGLFQRFLEEQERIPDRRMADDMQSALETLKQLVTYLTKERKNQGNAISEILLTNHPVFRALKTITATPYPVFFRQRDEMEAWLKARGWKPVSTTLLTADDDFQIWERPEKSKRLLLSIYDGLFDERGRLRVLTADEWNSDWVSMRELSRARSDDFSDFGKAEDEDDDDLPF